jgi:hypothetical protein
LNDHVEGSRTNITSLIRRRTRHRGRSYSESSNRIEAEQVIEKFTTVIDLVKAGSRAQADQLYDEASQQYDSLKVKRLHAEDLMPEHQSWWSTKVDSILGEVTQLTTDIGVLQAQIDALVKEKKG